MSSKLILGIYTVYFENASSLDGTYFDSVKPDTPEPILLSFYDKLDYDDFEKWVVGGIDGLYNREILRIEKVDGTILDRNNFNIMEYKYDIKHCTNPLYVFYGEYLDQSKVENNMKRDQLVDTNKKYIIVQQDCVCKSAIKSARTALLGLQSQVENLLLQDYMVNGTHNFQIIRVEDKFYCISTQSLVKKSVA